MLVLEFHRLQVCAITTFQKHLQALACLGLKLSALGPGVEVSVALQLPDLCLQDPFHDEVFQAAALIMTCEILQNTELLE